MKEKIELIENLTPEKIDEAIKILEKIIKEDEEALLSNVEYPSKKEWDKMTLSSLKRGGGWSGWLKWLSERQTRHLENKIKRNNYRPPKKMTEENRKFLEEGVKRHKDTITFMKKLKEGMIKYPNDWKNRKMSEL